MQLVAVLSIEGKDPLDFNWRDRQKTPVFGQMSADFDTSIISQQKNCEVECLDLSVHLFYLQLSSTQALQQSLRVIGTDR